MPPLRRFAACAKCRGMPDTDSLTQALSATASAIRGAAQEG